MQPSEIWALDLDEFRFWVERLSWFIEKSKSRG
jgi:hypothetical protein